MLETDAIVLPPRKASLIGAKVGGLPLLERAVLTLTAAGVPRILVPGRVLDDAKAKQLIQRGAPVHCSPTTARRAVEPGHALIVVSADVIFEPRAIGELVARSQDHPGHAVGASAALGGVLAYLPAELTARLDGQCSLLQAIWQLHRDGLARLVDLGTAFCRPLPPDGRTWEVEAEDLGRRYTTGSLVRRAARVLAVPTSQVLLRLGVPARALRVAGLALAVVAVLRVSLGGSASWVIAALLCSAAVVLGWCADDVAAAGFSPGRDQARAAGRPTRGGAR